MRCPLQCFVGCGIRTMLANFHMCGFMLLLRAVLNILVRNASSRGHMCFRCLMFSLAGPCELLFLFCFIVSRTWVVVSVMTYHCMLCVAVLLVSCVSDSVCEMFYQTIHNIFGSGCYFVVECYGSIKCKYCLWCDVCSVVCPCHLFCSELMCCLEEVYKCLQQWCV